MQLESYKSKYLRFQLENLIDAINMKIMVPLAEGFEEIEAITVVDVLRRAGIEVDTVGVMGSVVSGSHGIKTMTDKKLLEINSDEYDGIILIGGNPGYLNLGKSSKIIEILKRFDSNKKMIAAICGAPTILAKAGLLEQRKATIFPGMEKELPHPRGEKVVVDGNIITSQAAGTAMEFALAIVGALQGKDKVFQLKRQLVA